MASAGIGFAFLAGVLSTLSPCVLPLLPIVLGSAASEHRFGPAALALGLALSFVAIGLFAATLGYGIGLKAVHFRFAGAAILIAIGALLVVPPLSARVAVAAGPASGWIENRLGGFDTGGLGGQFALGLLLGAVWSPCVGPTLGAASLLAARGQNLAEVGVVMAAFGVGAALPLLLLGLASREALQRWRSRLLEAGQRGKLVLGLALIAVGVLVITGLDKAIEAWLVAASPDWLTDLTTRF